MYRILGFRIVGYQTIHKLIFVSTPRKICTVYKKFFDNIYLFLENKRIFINLSIFPGIQIFNVNWCTYTTQDSNI
jgi:hypothetical protein